MQVFRYRALKSFRMPYFVLDPGTVYACRVRYYDQHGLASEWSPAVSFTTTGTEQWWSDEGVTEGQEVSAETDLNNNGIADLDETETIRSIRSADGSRTMAVSIATSQDVQQIDGVGAIDPYAEEEIPPVDDLEAYGLIVYRIRLARTGQTTAVSLYFSGGVDDQTAWMSVDNDGEYDDCGETVMLQSDGSVVRWLTDGGEGDLDGTANGVVVDMLGPRQTATEDGGGMNLDDGTDASTSSSGGGSCFIQSLMH
jgi:hypothetical protein